MMKHSLRYTRLKALSYSLTALVTIGLSAPLPAAEKEPGNKTSQSKYGAIAHYCDQTDHKLPRTENCGIGYSNNHASQEEANQKALEKCGVSGCKVVEELVDVCGVVAEVYDTWEVEGEKVGYSFRVWTNQEDGLKQSSLEDLESTTLEYCNEMVTINQVFLLPGYPGFKTCSIVESSCPTSTPPASTPAILPITAESVIFTAEELKNMEIPKPTGYMVGEYFEGAIGQNLIEMGLLKETHIVYHLTYPSVLGDLLTEPVKKCNSAVQILQNAIPSQVSVYLHEFMATDYSLFPFPIPGDDHFGMANCYYDLAFDKNTVGDYGQGDRMAITYCNYAKIPQDKFSNLYNTTIVERSVISVYRTSPDNPVEVGEVLVFDDLSYVHVPVVRVYQPGEAFPFITHTGNLKGTDFLPAWKNCQMGPVVSK